MEFVDTHTHIFLPDFNDDRTKVIENAVAKGVSTMLLPNIDSKTVEQMLAVCLQYPGHCYPMIGLHPTSVDENFNEEIENVSRYLRSHKFVAIGEVGIDLYWDKTYFTQQVKAFEMQIDLAREYHLPLVIHSRDSFNEIIEVLERKRQAQPYSGVFHSFGGTLEQAQKAISLGFKLGINGVVTFKNSKLAETLADVPITELLLETDSPYLTPAPFRGKRNDSSHLILIAQRIADCKHIDISEVARITTDNAKKLFNLPQV